MSEKVNIRRLLTGVPGLDEVLGGGLPEFSFNLIAGAPGTGKTTLSQQIMFANIDAGRSALYFTVLGEPPLKMLRYQQQFAFFDVAQVNAMVRFVNLGDVALTGDFARILRRIVSEIEHQHPDIVVVDSFRSVVLDDARNSDMRLQQFVRQLALELTALEATSFLVGEYSTLETETNPVFTVTDGLLWLEQSVERNSMVRKLQVSKMRGQNQIPGLHTFRITERGIQVFPRLSLQYAAPDTQRGSPAPNGRLSIGIPDLDEMLGGGIPTGYSLLVAGPSGSGKSLLATEFICEGARAGERGIIATFEQRPAAYSQTGPHAGELRKWIAEERVKVIHSRPLDLSIDEMLHELIVAIQVTKASRVVIDSLSGFELALAPTFRTDFRESLHRMVMRLTGVGVTVLMTSELEDRFIDLRLSPHGVAFLTDAIIMQRYVELEGRLQRVMGVVKVRGSPHSTELRRYDVTREGLRMAGVIDGYGGLLSGHPSPSVAKPPS